MRIFMRLRVTECTPEVKARAHAVGTAKDLADYFRMPVAEARPRLRVLGKWFEGRKTAAVAAALSAELRVLEDWLV